MKKAVIHRDARSKKTAAKKEIKRWIIGIVVLLFALLYFFPILYMILSGFKTEVEAAVPAIFSTQHCRHGKKYCQMLL